MYVKCYQLYVSLPINLQVAALVAMVDTMKNQLEKDKNQLQFKCYEQEFTAKHISPERRSTDTATHRLSRTNESH